MLSDDITKMVGTGISTVTSVIGGAVRGGVMFGLLALAVVSCAVALPAVLGAATIGAGIGAFLGALPAAIAGAGWTAATLGAAAGAAVMGVSSVIPGSKEGYGRNQPASPPGRAPSAATVDTHAQGRAAYAATGMENPHYREGLGASLAAQRTAAADAGMCK